MSLVLKKSLMSERSILIISDAKEILKISSEVMKEDKYRVVTASTAYEARLKFSNEEFQMAIIDMDLRAFNEKDFVDSIRRKERLRNLKDHIPLLIIGKDAGEYSKNFASVDNVKFLETPFDKMELKKKYLSFTGNSDVIFKNTHKIAKDEYLITEGGTSHEMYWILSGKFIITKLNSDDNNVIIGEVHPGELVGEMSFLDSLPRSASVKALEESEVLVIPHKKFIDVLDHQPRWFKSLMQTMSQRLRGANQKIARKIATLNSDESPEEEA